MKTIEWYQLSKFDNGKYYWTGTYKTPLDYRFESDGRYYWTRDKAERDRLNNNQNNQNHENK